MSEAAKPRKSGRGKKIVMLAGGALLLIGGGVGAGFFAAGAGLGGAKAHEVEDPDAPKLVLKEGEHGPIRPSRGHDDSEAPEDPGIYQASYYNMEQSFTSNLRDSDGFAQVGLGVSTYYDQKVLDNFKANEMPIRSAILMTLSNQEAFVLETPEGKDQLRKELKTVVNKVLKSRTGFGGIDDVYFTSFIIQ